MTTNTPALPEVGSIWVSTYGYEACIAEFFVVERVTEKSIWLTSIAAKETGTWMAGTSEPIQPVVRIEGRSYRGSSRYLLKRDCCGWSAKRNSFSSIHPWSGSPVETFNHH